MPGEVHGAEERARARGLEVDVLRGGGRVGPRLVRCIALSLLLCALPAGAQTKREVPDYDGRAPEGTSAGDVALWVPRVLLFPLYLVSEYGVRVPLGALITHAERHRWPYYVYEALTFGERHQAGIYPTGYVDFGFRPSVGVRFFWNGAFAEGNSLRAAVAYGGTDWLLASLSDRYQLSGGRNVGVRLSFQRRPDHLFHGLGPRSGDDDEARYGLQQLEGLVELEQRFGRGPSAVRLSGGVRAVRFRNDSCCDNPGVVEQVEAGVFPALPGVGDRFTSPFIGAELILDSRRPRPARRSGALLRLHAENTFRSRDGENAGWIRYGGHLEGFLDLAWEARVVSLALDAEFVDPVGTQPVPFFELAGPNGTVPLAAFRPGRLVDRSAASVSLRYSWPVWAALDGQLIFAAGNVFRERLEGLEPDLLRLSATIGVSSEDVAPWLPPVEFLLGVGSEPLERGLRFSSVRFVARAAL
jgi:hypothetical protein